MLQIQEIKEVGHGLDLTDWSSKEFNRGDGKILIRRSKHVWSLTDDGELLAVAGLSIPSVMAVPEVWLLLCRSFPRKLRRNIVYTRDYFESILDQYPRIEARIDAEFGAGRAFAKVMGFKEITSEVLNDNREYIVCEVNRGR